MSPAKLKFGLPADVTNLWVVAEWQPWLGPSVGNPWVVMDEPKEKLFKKCKPSVESCCQMVWYLWTGGPPFGVF